MSKEFFTLLQEVYKEIDYKSLNYYLAQKSENNNLPSLDYYARDFLSLFYKDKIETKESLDYYLALWRYEAVLHNVKFAKENSEHYKDITVRGNIDIDACIADLVKIKADKSIICLELKKIFDEFIVKLPFCTSSDLEVDSEAFLTVSSKDIVGVSNLDPTGKAYQVREDDAEFLEIESQKVENRKKRIYYSALDLSSMLNFIFFGMQDIIKRQDAKILLMMSPGKAKTAGVLFCATMQRLGVECKVINFSTDYEHIAKEVVSYNANVLFGVPWNLHALSAYIKSKKIKHDIEVVILNGDTASMAMRKQIEKNISCKVYLHYGMTEIGFGGAVECDYHDGLHLRMIDLLIEIVDENLQKVEDGIDGEIVITSLTRHAIPLIRYRTGDRGRIHSADCPCCSSMQKIEVYGYSRQGVHITENKFLHLSDFQDFFYQDFETEIKDKAQADILSQFVIFDFEMCLFTDEEKQKNCILIGLELSSNVLADEKAFIDNITALFAEKFDLPSIENQEKSSEITSEDIEAFYICSKDKYEAILQKNAEKQLVDGEDFENSQELDRAFALSITKLDTFFAAKKVILSSSGTLL